MFNPQMTIAAILAVITSLSIGFYSGQDWATTKADAEKVEMMVLLQEKVEQERVRADELSKALSIAEGRIITKTVEVIKYVPKFTTGKPCLDAAAVSLLQPGSGQGFQKPASAPDAESAAPAASDTDIAYWIADANNLYETCAVRLNTLIDFEASE
ncbi:MAG: hypothetical protein KKH74_06505 [Gammaproteobacteria bacterium]|nr:hypothetical protein [Gammaproteobacteria bacterium]MBU1732294.1 hypothetical protein [Gammaproteobacteria bacterium]MBU1893864.1 hypothetical protein [Gammaproteobacteria bacterium]